MEKSNFFNPDTRPPRFLTRLTPLNRAQCHARTRAHTLIHTLTCHSHTRTYVHANTHIHPCTHIMECDHKYDLYFSSRSGTYGNCSSFKAQIMCSTSYDRTSSSLVSKLLLPMPVVIHIAYTCRYKLIAYRPTCTCILVRILPILVGILPVLVGLRILPILVGVGYYLYTSMYKFIAYTCTSTCRYITSICRYVTSACRCGCSMARYYWHPVREQPI